jgi:hypothetical protein
MYLLPTRATRRYRGKYPHRIHSWAYSQSPSQRALGAFLSLRKPVHIELNDGRRFIASISELLPNQSRMGVEFEMILRHNPCTIDEMSQEMYDQLLELVRRLRRVP